MTETPKETFKRLLYTELAATLEKLFVLCRGHDAPEEVLSLFDVSPGNARSIRDLIDVTLDEADMSFLK